jgi:hypothetical protein
MRRNTHENADEAENAQAEGRNRRDARWRASLWRARLKPGKDIISITTRMRETPMKKAK